VETGQVLPSQNWRLTSERMGGCIFLQNSNWCIRMLIQVWLTRNYGNFCNMPMCFV
jgi:hypothetical protein